MASPPNSSRPTSPPYASSLGLTSKKRASTSNPSAPAGGAATGNGPPAKRRKASVASTASNHPLRQTSFAQGDGHRYGGTSSSRAGSVGGRFTRSPSLEGNSVTGGGGGGGGGAGRGRRGGRGGSVSGRGRRTDLRGSVDGRTGPGSATGDGAASATGRQGDEEDDEDEDDADVDDGMIDTGAKTDEEQEKQKLGILIDAFDSEQSDRYDAFRRAKLQNSTVRKIANQTLSQSVPEQVVKTINGFTKVFIGEIIGRSREVQDQWQKAEEEGQPNGTHAPGQKAVTGPLLPDHLREAIRRYRQDREGGGAGMRAMSLAGMSNGFATAGRKRGKRLFQ